MLVRELVGGDPPYACKVTFLDQPAGFGHRVVDGGRVVEHVLTRHVEFEAAVAAKLAEGVRRDRAVPHPAGVRGRWDVLGRRPRRGRRPHAVRQGPRGLAGVVRGGPGPRRAVASYLWAVAEKVEAGYRELHPRPVVIPDAPTPPKPSGKRKSR